MKTQKNNSWVSIYLFKGSIIEILEKGVIYSVVLVSLLLTLNISYLFLVSLLLTLNR